MAARSAAGELAEAPALTIMITLFSAAAASPLPRYLGVRRGSWLSHPKFSDGFVTTPSLLGAFIEEVLRYEPPFRGHYRHVWPTPPSAGLPTAGSHLLLMWGPPIAM